MKVVIVDDETNNIETLKLLLKNTGKDIEILGEATSSEEGLKLIHSFGDQVDLLFLDIQMPNGDGFYLLSQLKNIQFKIVFVTAYDQFALKAIKFSALDYLLKPIDPEELDEALNKFMQFKPEKKQEAPNIAAFRNMLSESRNLFERIAITSYNDVQFVHIEDITYLRSDNNYTSVYTAAKEPMISSKNLGYYEELLENHPFCRTHNSYLVNLMKVKKYIKGKSGYLELEDGTKLEVSVRRKDEVLAKLRIV